MSKRPPHGGKPPQPRQPGKRGHKQERLYIPDVQAAIDRIWTIKKKPKSS